MPDSNAALQSPPWLWDVFCRVIDNHGDLGVLLRLSRQLGALGHQVRLWVDDASALAWMAPDSIAGVQMLPWSHSERPECLHSLPMADAWVEGFGCELPENFVANFVINKSEEAKKNCKKPVWLNLEYLTAESYAERCHGLPSPVMSGPAQGWIKHFYYPGFSPQTGGLLREVGLLEEQATFDRAAWLRSQGITWHGERLVSLFCYEPRALGDWLHTCVQGATPTRLLVAHGRPAAVVRAVWPAVASGAVLPDEPPSQPLSQPPSSRTPHPLPEHQQGALTVQFLPPLPQADFDRLLRACDWNFVRGEDSLVRAIWAGKPYVWHIYPQDDGAHHAKLNAFLDRLDAPPSIRHWHHWWNQDAHQPMGVHPPEKLPNTWLPARDTAWFETARQTLLSQPDLTTQLIAFIQTRTPTVQCAVTFQPPGV